MDLEMEMEMEMGLQGELSIFCRNVKVPRKPRSTLGKRVSGEEGSCTKASTVTEPKVVDEETVKHGDGLLRFCRYPNVPRKSRSALGSRASIRAPIVDSFGKASVTEKKMACESLEAEWKGENETDVTVECVKEEDPTSTAIEDDKGISEDHKISTISLCPQSSSPASRAKSLVDASAQKSDRNKRARDWIYGDVIFQATDHGSTRGLNGKCFCLRGGKEMFEEEMEDYVTAYHIRPSYYGRCE